MGNDIVRNEIGQYVRGQSGNPTGQNHREPWRIKELARQYTETAIETLVEIARSGSSESARVAAAVAILDRGWGKPPVQVQMEPAAPSYRVVRLPAPVKSIDDWFERYAPKDIVEARLKAKESGSDTVSKTLTQ